MIVIVRFYISAVQQAMQPFLSLMEDNVNVFLKLSKNVEDMIKLFSDWLSN